MPLKYSISKNSMKNTEAAICYFKRKLDKTHTQDASILYGCSGLYYIYKEIYNRTYDKAYLASCEYWYQQIFSFRNPEKKLWQVFNSNMKMIGR